jgi:hypothetical protein
VAAGAWPPVVQNSAPSGEEKRKEESLPLGEIEMRISVQVVAMCFSLNPAPNMYPRIKDTLIYLFPF